MTYVDNDGAGVYYEAHGSGPGVLFVHGSGGHHAAWWQQVSALMDDYTVITVDLRGFGNTRWSADRAVAEKVPVLDRLLTPELGGAPFPLLLLAGGKDAVLSPSTVRRAGELLPNARVEVVADAPHSMYWERPDLFNDAIRRFLKDCLLYTSPSPR